MPTIRKFPDVYVEKQSPQPNVAIASSNITTCALIGQAQRGERNKAVLIKSWAEYIEKFAKDMNTPFVPKQSYLAYAVYGYFQNGGSDLYVVNASNGTEKSATATVGGITLNAIEAGEWGNDLYAKVKSVEGKENEYVVDIYLGDTATDTTLKESITIVNAEDVDKNTVFSALSTSKFVSPVFAETYEITEAAEPVQFSNGTNGGVVDYNEVLKAFDQIEDNMLISIVDDNTAATNKILNEYCTKNDQMVAVTGVESETTTADDVLKDYLEAGREYIFYPSWGGTVDPITGETMNVPMNGHVMGWIVKSTTVYGLSKVPAGVNAQLVGIVSLPVELDKVTAGNLNDNNVVCIVNKKNYGICVWGGRTQVFGGDDEGNRYINSLMLETMVYRDLESGLQPFLFRPNVPATWADVRNSIDNYMRKLMSRGALYSGVASESYRVICDSSNNTDQTVLDKTLNAEVWYREKGCAEFIVIKLSRSITAV